jgi:hypothetical protein
MKTLVSKYNIFNASSWDSIILRRNAWDFIAEENHIDLIEDWYKMKWINSKIRSNKSIHNNNTLHYSTLLLVYPETEWQPWRFASMEMPLGFWSVKENVWKFLDSVCNEMDYNGWYQLKERDLKSMGGSRLLKTRGSLQEIFKWLHGEMYHSIRKYFDWIAEELGLEVTLSPI